MNAFGGSYANVYDALYGEKDYAKECDMIEALLATPGGRSIRLLDLGCGTGNHAIPLAQRGHMVTGIDLSEAMLHHAREKADLARVSGRTAFYRGDIRTIRLTEKEFDSAIMMFAVLGYQQNDTDVRDTFRTVRAHLARGALIVFDVWYGPGVIADRPKPRERVVENGTERIIRKSSIVFDEQRHLCNVIFDLNVWRDGRGAEKAHEEHLMRFFFRDELNALAAECGLELLTLRDFADWRRSVLPSSWNAVGVLRAT